MDCFCCVGCTTEWRGDDAIDAGGRQEAASKLSLLSSTIVQVGIELTLNDSFDVFARFAVTDDEHPQLGRLRCCC